MIKMNKPSDIVFQHFSIKLKNPVNSSGQFWSYNIPLIKQAYKKITILIKKQVICLLNYEQPEYPKYIKFQLADFSGYINNQGNKTNKCAIFCLSDIVIDGQKKNLFYECNDVTWTAGNIRTIKIKIFLDDDDEPISQSIENELMFNFDLKYE